MQDILAGLPDKWWWSIEKPLPECAAFYMKKRKKIFYRYTVYVSNGETFGTKAHASATAHGDNLDDTLRWAINSVRTGEPCAPLLPPDKEAA